MPAQQRRFRVRRAEPTTELFALAGEYATAGECDRVRENVHALGHVARVVRTVRRGSDGKRSQGWALYVWVPEDGRPRNPRGGRRRSEEVRVEAISVKVTPTEKRAIEERAARLGREAGPYLRELGMGSARGVRVVEVPAANRKAHQQLRRLGVNLNQVAARLNEAAANRERVELKEEERALLAEIRAAVLRLQSGLLGRAPEGGVP